MYADANDYTYPATAERILAQSNNWPGDVDRQLIDQQAKNIRLEESNAWLEGELAEQRQEIDALKARVLAQGRQLGRLAKMMEGRTNDAQ